MLLQNNYPGLMAKTGQPIGFPALTHPAVIASTMINDNIEYSDYAAYLTRFLGREPHPAELISFVGNQDLMLINRRSLENNAYRIQFVNGTAMRLLPDWGILGGSIQLHSHQEGYRFYSVMFEEQGAAEEYYLILEATIESVMIGGLITTLVQQVRLITIEELVQLYNPIMYNLA